MKETRQIMGMPVTTEVVGEADNEMREAVERSFRDLVWVDSIFSTYKPASQISRINRGELDLDDADATVRAVLQACDELRDRSDGYFDVRRSHGVDPSGYVKGWAIARAASELSRAGYDRYCVEAGGDLVVRGLGPDGGPWRVGICNPLRPQEIVKVLGVTDSAVATSGTYKRGEHIYDPHTGAAATALASVTVVGPDIVTADAYATVAFAMGASGASWVAAQGLECYVIGHDGVAEFSPGMKGLFYR